MSDYIDDVIESANLQSEHEMLDVELYSATVKSSRGSLIRTIRMQSGYEGGPTTGQLVYYLATRIQNVESCEDFLDWADETGHDASDDNALEVYRGLVAELDEVTKVFGKDTVNSLLSALSIDQAISRARSSLPK
jgi:hypothetical protein